MTYLARVQNKEIICTEISDPRRWFVRAEGLMKRLTGKKDIIPMKLRVCGEHGFRLGFTMLSVFALHRTKWSDREDRVVDAALHTQMPKRRRTWGAGRRRANARRRSRLARINLVQAGGS